MEREVYERSIIINEENPSMHSPRAQSLKERQIFHDTFSFLIKLVICHFFHNYYTETLFFKCILYNLQIVIFLFLEVHKFFVLHKLFTCRFF